jgi:hypothetical protein
VDTRNQQQQDTLIHFDEWRGIIKTWHCVNRTCYGAVKLENNVIFAEKAHNHSHEYTGAKFEVT